MVAFGSSESSVDKCSFSVVADVGKVWFQLVANSREIRVNGLQIDVETLECCVVA